MDAPKGAHLMGPHEEGSLNIVMLLLSGRATPYLHNGVIYVGDEDHYVSAPQTLWPASRPFSYWAIPCRLYHNLAFWLVLLSVYWYLKAMRKQFQSHLANLALDSKRQHCRYGWPVAVATTASCLIRIVNYLEIIMPKNDLNCTTIRAPVAIWSWALTIVRKTNRRIWSVEAAVRATSAAAIIWIPTMAQTYCETMSSLRRWNDWFIRNGPKLKSQSKDRYRLRWQIDINLQIVCVHMRSQSNIHQ